jgi:hypothetical protein
MGTAVPGFHAKNWSAQAISPRTPKATNQLAFLAIMRQTAAENDHGTKGLSD